MHLDQCFFGSIDLVYIFEKTSCMKKKASKPTPEPQVVTYEWLSHFYEVLEGRQKELGDVLSHMTNDSRRSIESKNWKTAVRGLDYIQKFTAGLLSSLVETDEETIALLMNDPTGDSLINRAKTDFVTDEDDDS